MNRTLLTLSFFLLQLSLAQAQERLPRMDYFNFAFHKHFFDVSGEQNVWELKEHDCAEDIPPAIMASFEGVSKHSQSHLLAMLKSDMRLATFALTVPERQYFTVSGLDAENFSAISRCLGGFQRASEALLSDNVRYFEEILQYLRYLRSIEKEPYYDMGRKYEFKIIRSLSDFDAVLENPTQIGGLFSIFGAHNLSNYFFIKEDLVGSEEYQALVRKNIERLKGIRPLVEHGEEYLDYPILSLSIAGAFRNGLGGDTKRSVLGSQEATVFEEAIPATEALTTTGQEVVRQLLDKKSGRRILVDVAGLSVKARKWLYRYYNDLRYQGDTIPVIATGVTVHGESWDHEKMDNDRHNKDLYLPIYGEAMAREDLRTIIESQGLLSIPLDRAQLTHDSKWRDLLKEQVLGSAEHRNCVVKLIVSHLLRSIQVIQDRSMWSHLSICTSFDGANRPFTIYNDASKVRELEEDIKAFLKNPTDIYDLYTAEQVQQFMYDYTAEELVEKLFSKNAIDFTRKQLQALEQQKIQTESVNKD